MQISFIILFMIDLYKDNHRRACMYAFVNFFYKKTSQKLLTGPLPNFIVETAVLIQHLLNQSNRTCI